MPGVGGNSKSQQGAITKGQEKTLGNDRYVYNLDFGDVFIGVHTRQNPANCAFKVCNLLYVNHKSIKLFKISH